MDVYIGGDALLAYMSRTLFGPLTTKSKLNLSHDEMVTSSLAYAS